MKKSNKLLLGGFLTVILIIAGVHIALYAKYKNGNYTIQERGAIVENDRMKRFPNVSHVIIRNIRGASIRFGETAAVDKDQEDLVRSEQKGDSLIITGHVLNNERPDGLSAIIILPYNVTIETDSVSLIALQSNQFLKTKITTVSNNP